MSTKKPNDLADEKSANSGVAYLVVREGRTWRDVFRLIPGQVTTVGRAPTNRIVIRDEICSRNHCEIFQSAKHWTVRDLGSRNGTLINGTRISGDWTLEEGQLIQIGACDLGFTYDISRPFAQFERSVDLNRDTETALDVVFDQPASESSPAILHRARRSRYESSSAPDVGRDRTSQELAKLYRLALEMGTCADSKSLSETVLDGLFSGTSADIGAILLLPEGVTTDPNAEELRVVAYKAQDEAPYQRVSVHLSGVVLAEREAVLARDVADDSRLIGRDGLGEIHAKSVICAPVRAGRVVHGLIHLYSTNHEVPLNRDDLEFTLAVADQFAVALENLKERETLAVGLARAQDENLTLRQQLEIESELVGDSLPMQKLRANIARVAPVDTTVLIRGESGVGKELVARAIHFSSLRRKAPFICMNCAALSESLLESELFGHEKGSFTGATNRKFGKFEQADKGTLFLDEVGEMSQAIQAKFLRVLEGHPFERVGGGTPIRVDVRVVAATNRDLEKAAEEGRFRKDLYFRLHVVEIHVPPLREHVDDIAQLANHFLARFARKINRPVQRFTQAALEMLTQYPWPGNVRELQNAVERAVILCPGTEITEADIQLSGLSTPEPARRAGRGSQRAYRPVPLAVIEQEHILATLDRTQWNKSQAAEILGIERSTLDRKLKRFEAQNKLGIEKPQSDDVFS